MINYDGAGVCDDGSRYGWVMVVWLGMVHMVWGGVGWGARQEVGRYNMLGINQSSCSSMR